MILRYFIVSFFVIISSINVFSQAGDKEKIAILQKNFNSTNDGGPTWNQFGDLVFEKNNKTYWLSTFCSVVDVAEDYYRLFEIDFISGTMKEVTKEMLGNFYPVGALNPPYYYEDVDNDGIKDILIFDHGKEIESLRPDWSDYNVFFKGNDLGFKKTDLLGITTEKKYYHAHALNDFDNDGDLDIAYGSDITQIFANDGKGRFFEQKIQNLEAGTTYRINNQRYNVGTFGLLFSNLDNDKELELLATVSEQPIYLDYKNGVWTANLFGESGQFVWKKNIHIGVEQTLEIINPKTKKNDYFFRVTTNDIPMEGGSQMKWMTKMFMSKSPKVDSIYLLQNDLSKSNSFLYLDPKLVDLNFDGAPDLFFKEDEFWGNTGQKLHSINQRIWLNDGDNNFNPSKLKFSDEANQLVYILAKSDSIKKINILFSQRGLPFDKNGKFSQDIRYLYNRIDTIVYPIQNIQTVKLCIGTSLKSVVSKVPVGILVVDNSNSNNSITKGPDYLQIEGKSVGEGIITYKLNNEFFEGETNTIKYSILDKPSVPIISKYGGNLVSSNTRGNQWYLDGVKLQGETSNKITVSSSGIYTVQSTSTDGCMSDISKGEFGLITSTVKEENLDFYPNPFIDIIKISFPSEFGNLVDIKIIDTKGIIRFDKKSIHSGETIDLSFLSIGSYIFNLSSIEMGKFNSSKIVKIN